MENATMEQLFVFAAFFAVVGVSYILFAARRVIVAPVRRYFPGLFMSSGLVADVEPTDVHDQDDPPVPNEPNEPANGGSEAFRRGEPHGTAGSVLALNDYELNAVHIMRQYREREIAAGRTPSKTQTIYSAFKLKRGGGKYQRASEIYDLLFADPQPIRFRTLDAQRQPVTRKKPAIAHIEET